MTRLLEGRAGPWGLSSQTLYFSDEKPGSQRHQSHTEFVITWNQARPQECSGGEPVPPYPVWPEYRGWVLSVHTAMLTQQGLGHRCVSPVGALGLHSQLGQGGGPPRRLQGGCSWPIRFLDPSLRFRTGWLGVREAASANAPPCLGLTQPSPATHRPASALHGEATRLFLSQVPRSLRVPGYG